ncbi:vWA domain-containing protein [Pseudogemmobacter humi]|uniref:vWA domain-containing protein n=1 Tax=Pseudogemmobacter humi TaxID=2483812 RepID=UPI000F547421|nr:VWA domain-containing protein [Pseudogemmobacter humi]
MNLLRALVLALGLTAVLPAFAEGRSIIVLDASGSMWGQIDGRAKLEIAREALGTVLSTLPAETEIGLMAYGHREKGDCGDIELVVPPGKGTAAAIVAAAQQMKFLGKTPLTAAVRQAAADLHSTEEKATVILITDGIETCEADPCALGRELETSGVDFTAHVVGFGLTADEGRAVACLAENTGGRYIQASDAGQLEAALKTTVAAEPEPAPPPEPAPAKLDRNIDPVLLLTEGGKEPEIAADAIFDFYPLTDEGPAADRTHTLYGNSVEYLAPGRYLMKTRLHKATTEQEIEVTDSELAQPVAVLDAGLLRLRVLANEGGEPDGDAWFEIRGPGDIVESGYGKATVVLPAQEYALSLRLGAAEVSQSFVIVAGGELVKDVVMGVGVAAFSVVYAADAAVSDGDLHTEIFEAKTDLEGNRKSLTYAWGPDAKFDLAPGEYLAVVSLDAVQARIPLTIRVNERSEIRVDLQAGVAAFTTPGDELIEVLSAAKDIEGNRKQLAYGYGPEWQTVLPAGDLVVRVEKDGTASETPVTVKPGERLELSLKAAP